MIINLQTINEIEKIVKQLIKKYNTNDPYELADWLNISVDFADHPDLLGFCSKILGNTYIALNARANYYTRRSGCAHELGHIVLKHLPKNDYVLKHACNLSNMSAKLEAPANCFGATLLMNDYDTIEAVQRHSEANRIAASLNVCPELLQAKIIILKAKGYDLTVPEIRSSDTWRNYIKTDANYEA